MLLIVLLAVLVSGALKSREDYMQRLPVYKRYMCALCHSVDEFDTQPSGSNVNDFGRDFARGGYVWDAALAAMDSDGDDYPNGIELGDEDGDGEPETLIERSNPGDRLNNPSSIDKDTWGIIKNLFKD
ncbi:MAG TPA: hypothetical protein ENO08_08600 [Candidatus Eisenbacteria bacterium]|uniref:Temptin Cys/Cys disulfide domain-containing protein n=1 Tax=Eiseniibacteriota bacterium TaxID=2212470 RepID=A0A7V2AWE0_UNCEI|nr:hypothetical protein [Candidatus Eisenbacteria bacterium]